MRITLLAALVLTVTPPPFAAQSAQFERIVSDPLGADSCFNAAWADINGDGLVDVCTLNGSLKLYQNNGDGTFASITNGNAVVAAAVDLGFGMIWGDYDNDGLPDLFVLAPFGHQSTRNYLFRNDGGWNFTEILEGHIVTTNADSFAGAWGDFNQDGWLDLFVSNFIRSSEPSGQNSNFLYANDSQGAFEFLQDNPVTQPFTRASGLSAQGLTTADFDGDGRLDILRITVNWSSSQLLLNQGGFSFSTRSPLGHLASPDAATAAAAADYDNDGDMDFITIAASGQDASLNLRSYLWRNDGNANFTRVIDPELSAPDAGAGVGVAWGDYDNDGWLDVVMSRDDFTHPSKTTNLLFHNNGDGTFSQVTEGEIVTDTGRSQTSTWTDINNDGFLDLLICNYNQANLLMLNKGNTNHWLKLVLKGTASNADAIGAKVRAKATINGTEVWQLREISTSQGWLTSQNDMRPHFGLGNATAAEMVRIEWPSGQVTELSNVPANQILTIVEPPALEIRPAVDQAVTLAWLSHAEGFSLFGAADLAGPWIEVQADVAVDGATSVVTLPATERVRLFQLRSQTP